MYKIYINEFIEIEGFIGISCKKLLKEFKDKSELISEVKKLLKDGKNLSVEFVE